VGTWVRPKTRSFRAARQLVLLTSDNLNVPNPHNAYTFSMWVRPEKITTELSNLIHKGATEEERSPALYFEGDGSSDGERSTVWVL
jgi:hypothetical protein